MADSGFHPDQDERFEPIEPLLDWPRLLSADNPDALLRRIGAALQPHCTELLLKNVDEVPGTLVAQWRAGPASGCPPHQVEISGDPRWRLTIRFAAGAPQLALVERALLAIEAWRSTRHDLREAETRVAARSRELDLIQALGRHAAEARDLHSLFRCAVDLLQSAEDIDVAVAAFAAGGRKTLLSFEARPVEEAARQSLAQRACELLGWPLDDLPSAHVEPLSGWDATRGSLQSWDAASLVLLPVPRGERMAACLALLPATHAGDGSLRLCYAVANQLSLHLDRILTVQEAEADRFRAILDSMPQAVLLTDAQLGLLQANPAAQELLAGLDLPLAGSMVAAIRQMGMKDALNRVLGGTQECDHSEVQGAGNRTYSLSVTRLAGAREDAGLVLVIADITQTRRMQLQLAHSEKMSSLGRMISGVTHELNNPLTSIMGYAQLIRAGVGEGKVAQRSEMLESEARRCQKIVRNLLSFARRREVEHGALSLNEVIETVLGLMNYQFRVDAVEVVTELCPDVPAVHGDQHQLQQVLVNLLTNAYQAIRSCAPSGTIRIRTAYVDGHAVVEVEDDGPGIPQETHAQIFDPFFTTKPEGEGTGLGLSLVYGIVRDHEGSIEALPATPRGAIFRVVLPLRARTPVQPLATEPVVEPQAAQRARILVVDDNIAIAKLICESLRERGHEPFAADGAEAALAALEKHEFGLVISDLRMPGIDGEALFQRIRVEHPELAQRLLLTTADTAGRSVDEVAAATGCSVLAKPFDIEALHAAVQERLFVRTLFESSS